MTVWCGPDTSPCFEHFYSVVKAYGNPEVSAPTGPDFHQFANQHLSEELFSQADFDDFDFNIVDCYWDLSAPDDLFEIFAKGTVRAAMLLANQPPENFANIRAFITSTVRQRFKRGNRWRVPVPAALSSASA